MTELTHEDLMEMWRTASKDDPIRVDTALGRQVMKAVELENKRATGKGVGCGIIPFKPFISPIDGSEITGLQSLEAHNRKHGVQQVGHEMEAMVREEQERRREIGP